MSASYVSFSCVGHVDARALRSAIERAADGTPYGRALIHALPSPSSARDAIQAVPSIARRVSVDAHRLSFQRVADGGLAVIAVRNVGRNASTTLGRFVVSKGERGIEYVPADGVAAALSVPTASALRECAAEASATVGATYGPQRLNKWLTNLATRAGGVKITPTGALYLLGAAGADMFAIAKTALADATEVHGGPSPVVHIATLSPDATSSASAWEAIERHTVDAFDELTEELESFGRVGARVTAQMIEARKAKAEDLKSAADLWLVDTVAGLVFKDPMTKIRPAFDAYLESLSKLS